MMDQMAHLSVDLQSIAHVFIRDPYHVHGIAFKHIAFWRE